MTVVYTERAFQEAVADCLIEYGCHRGDPADFD
jgi:hypothetical protein